MTPPLNCLNGKVVNSFAGGCTNSSCAWAKQGKDKLTSRISSMRQSLRRTVWQFVSYGQWRYSRRQQYLNAVYKLQHHEQ